MKTGSCCDQHDPQALTVEQALDHILAAITAVTGRQQLSLRQALDRTLAEPIHATCNVPPADNSAMDGYAIRAADLPTTGSRELHCIGTSWAGRPYNQTIGPGQCARIMTGALIPAGGDTVIMQEQTEKHGEKITIGSQHHIGENLRRAGEDITNGDLILPLGTHLSPPELGLLASLGRSEVQVWRRPRIAFFSTGDELRSLGEPLEAGQIYDSNRYTLFGMLSRLGVEPIDMGVVADRREAIKAAFTEAAEQADAIITTGGVSVGEADFVKDVLAETGQVGFWKIAMKPGRPLAFGHVHGSAFFGLPGNPVSVMATFYQFVQPALRRMKGEHSNPQWRFTVPCLEPLRKPKGRMDFQRGVLEPQSDGSLAVRTTGEQGSHILRSMSRANCFILLPRELTTVEAGSEVEVQPFAGLV